jgi:hypothetical protein
MKECGESVTFTKSLFREQPTPEQTVRPDNRLFRKDEEVRLTTINTIRGEFARIQGMPVMVVFEELPFYRQIQLLREEQYEKLKEKEPLASSILEDIGDFFSFIGNLLLAIVKPKSETSSS